MDPEAEYRRLVARYRGWKKGYKQRLAQTEQAIKRARKAGLGSLTPTKMDTGPLASGLSFGGRLFGARGRAVGASPASGAPQK